MPKMVVLLLSVMLAGGGSGAGKYRVVDHMFARRVGFDSEGRCKVEAGVPLKEWRIRAFPAKVPPFESCTTIEYTGGEAEKEFMMSILSPDGKTIQKIDGVLSFSSSGLASQAVAWQDLEIPKPGVYRFRIAIDGTVVYKSRIRFVRAKRHR